jgi:hypothetical protein
MLAEEADYRLRLREALDDAAQRRGQADGSIRAGADPEAAA